MDKPLVSVLMTVYNREKYIAQAIESVIASTYTNWELIILDDHSGDNSVTIARRYEKKDTRIKVYVNESNLGQFKNRNKIVDYASGIYLKYLDSDDLIYPYGLEQLVYYMVQFPEAGYGICSLIQDEKVIYPFCLTPQEAYQRHYIQNIPLFHKEPLSSIIKTEVFRETGGFPHEAVSGDFAMWCYLSMQYSVVLMPKGIIWYRIHSEQEMQKTRENVLVEFEYLKVEDYFLKHENCPLELHEVKKAIQGNIKKKWLYILWKSKKIGPRTGFKLWLYNKKPFSLNKINDI